MRDEIIEMAKEAGFEGFDPWACWPENLERFYNLAVQHEREACAHLIENMQQAARRGDGVDGWDAAAAIRARGEKQ